MQKYSKFTYGAAASLTLVFAYQSYKYLRQLTTRGNVETTSTQTPPTFDILFKAVQNSIYLDSSRLEVVKEACNNLLALEQNQLIGRNGFSRLLLGVKGCGKSALLMALANAARQYLSHVCVVYVDYSAGGKTQPLLDEIVFCLHSWRPSSNYLSIWQHIKQEYLPNRHFEVLETRLAQDNVRLFVVLDEFDRVYTARCPIGAEIVDDVALMSGRTNGVVYTFLSGSSSVLRQLVCGKLSLPCPDFPNYKKVDLNNTKFMPVTIFPFNSVEDLKGFANHRAKNFSLPLTITSKVYCNTGGIARLMIDAPDIPSFTASLREFGLNDANDPSGFVLREICSLVAVYIKNDRNNSSGDHSTQALTPISSGDDVSGAVSPSLSDDDAWLQFFCSLTRNVDATAIKTSFYSRKFQEDFTNRCFRLADAGLIRFNQATFSIALSFPNLFLQLDNTHDLSLYEILAFVKPERYNGKDAAGDATLRLLTQIDNAFGDCLEFGVQKLCGLKITHHQQECNV